MSGCSITGRRGHHQSSCIRQAVYLLRNSLETDMYFLLQALEQEPDTNGWFSAQDVEKYENGVKSCNLYLANSISLEDLCVLMNQYGLHQQLKQYGAKYMCDDIIAKYIGYDEFD